MDYSYGIIPVRETNGSWELFLIQNSSGKHWDFPKGHPIDGETPKETAVRELKEETALDVVKFLPIKSFQERYHFFHDGKRVDKTVVLFCAYVKGEVSINSREVLNCDWILLSDAVDKVTYDEAKRVVKEVGFVLNPG